MLRFKFLTFKGQLYKERSLGESLNTRAVAPKLAAYLNHLGRFIKMQWGLGIYIFQSSPVNFDAHPGLGTAVKVASWILAKSVSVPSVDIQ